MVVETTQKCNSKAGDVVGAAWCFQHSPPRATMTLRLLGTMILPGCMGTFGWGSPYLILCEVSLLPAAVWAPH